jgi:hypothetical protein
MMCFIAVIPLAVVVEVGNRDIVLDVSVVDVVLWFFRFKYEGRLSPIYTNFDHPFLLISIGL